MQGSAWGSSGLPAPSGLPGGQFVPGALLLRGRHCSPRLPYEIVARATLEQCLPVRWAPQALPPRDSKANAAPRLLGQRGSEVPVNAGR